jgi:predicted NAD-dependent protein-ADP-ribosyltransferase YbiA (DUF1768 family)
MIDTNCIVMGPYRDLYKEFPKLTESAFSQFVRRWQSDFNKVGEIPTKRDLVALIVRMSDNWAAFIDPEDVITTNVWYSREGRENPILSNFSERPFFADAGNGVETYNSVEQAFQMAKFYPLFNRDDIDPDLYDRVEDLLAKMADTTNPATLKKLGNTRDILSKEDIAWWDANKRNIMKNLIKQSMLQNPSALKALLATGNTILTHKQGGSEYRVLFPEVLEEVREELRGTTIELDNFMSPRTDKVITLQVKKPWRSDPSKVNDTMRIYLKSNPSKGYFELVKDEEDNYYSIHFKPTDKSNPHAFSDEEKEILFQAAANMIPSGAYLSTHGELTKGGIHGLERFGNLGFTEAEKRDVKTKGDKSSVTKIISGGQTGVDTIGLQVAKRLGIETGGTAPKGFLREEGIDSEDISSYGLVEITDEQQADYTRRMKKTDPWTARTELNVRNSDGTVYFSTKEDSLGLGATLRSARQWKKPFINNPSAQELADWIIKNNIKTLNVAGNRGSKLSKDNNVAEILEEALSGTKSSGITIPVWQKNDGSPIKDSGYIINEHEGHWNREEVAEDEHTLYIFTDNTDRTSGGNEIGEGWYAEKYGKGGYGTEHNPTSAVIRGLPNAAPISTMKWFYRNHGVGVAEARWTDEDLDEFKKVLDEEIEDIKRLWDTGNFNSIELPEGGIVKRGDTKDKSISQFNAGRVPKLVRYFNRKMQELAEYVKDEKKVRELQSTTNIDETNFHKADEIFTSIKKRQRINLINRLFSEKVEKEMNNTRDRLNGELKSAKTRKEQLRIAFQIRNLRPYVVIKQKRPYELFGRVKQIFQDYINMSQQNRGELVNSHIEKFKASPMMSMLPEAALRDAAERKVNSMIVAYNQILDNWNDLVLDAANTYSYDHGVIMDVVANDIEEDIDNTATDDEGNNKMNEDADAKEETPYKEGWQVNVRELSAFESMTNQVREAISKINRTDRKGELILDDLGYAQPLMASYVFAEIISSLRDMTSASQMLPMLRQLQHRKAWASQIVDAIEKDDRLFTAFYTVFRKDYLNMWIQVEKTAPDGSIFYKTVNINKPTGTAHYFDEWRDNLEYGIVLDDDSVYDSNGDIKIAGAQKGLELVDAVMDKFRDVKTREDRQNLILSNVGSIHKMLNMIGVPITKETLSDVLTYNVDLNSKEDLPGATVLSNLRVIFKGITDANNKGIKDGQPADLINMYGRAFFSIATAINNVEEDEIESSVRQGKKTLYAHTRPSYLTTLIKRLRGPEGKDFISREYKDVDFLYDKQQGRWLNSLIDDLENDAEAVNKLNHCVVIEHNRKEYEKWTPLDTFQVLFSQYNAEPLSEGEGYAWYQVPLLSDATSAEFIRAKRVKKNYREVLLNKFNDLVRQEYNRIVTVKERYERPDIEKIAYYDKTDDEENGAKFHFFPELNSERFNKDGKTFFEQLAEVADDTDTFNKLASEAVGQIMDENFLSTVDYWASIGVFDKVDENNENSAFKYFRQRTRENVESALREYYWNSVYMQSQIIQLLTTDLAYYGNYTNFTKRALEFHSPTEKLNTLAKWDGKYVLASEDENGNVTVRPERAIYLVDEVKPSDYMKEVEQIIDDRIAAGELTAADKTVIMKKWGKVTTTDAQAYRTLKSFRATQIAANLWDDESEKAYNNIRKGTWTATDFVTLWNTRKPYLYTQVNQDDKVGGTMRMAHQHKNSEMIMLTQSIFGAILHQSGKLKGLSEFMEEHDIDVAMFGTAVKVGGQGLIDINGVKDADKVKKILQEKTIKGKDFNPEVVHEFNWEDYGIQVATPEYGINAIQLVGTQLRRLIGTDMNANAEFEVGGMKLNRDQWRNYFNAVNTANIREAYEALDKKFNDPKQTSDLLISEIKSNARYSNDLIEAVSLDENGNFKIPLFDFTQSQKIQELLNSIIKTRIVKQKIAGGALIQASAWALNEKDKPHVVWGTDANGKKYIKYMEAYIACPDDRLYDLLLEDDGSININKRDSKGHYIVPEKYRQAIGYRIPTEDKYSMIPIKVKGFLPRQVGSVIILPDEITNTTGSDFDVDKIYMMYHTLDFKNMYDIKKAWDDFYKDPANFDIVSEIDENFGKALEQYIAEQTEDWDEAPDGDDIEDFREEFKGWLKKEGVKKYHFSAAAQNRFTDWFNLVKDSYYTGRAIRVTDYKKGDVDPDDKVGLYKQAKSNKKKQRDGMMIDLIWSVLTNSDTVSKQVNPGNFDEQKRDARLMNLLDALSLDQIDKLGGINKILNLDLKPAEKMLEKYGKVVNPLAPDTWVKCQQRNMSGAGLVPMAATQNASHALTQLTSGFGLREKYQFKFNGKRLGSLHSVKSAQGNFISKNVCSFLAAFVDNAKDPVAGDLNINETTANLAFLLLRVGNSPLTTGLILRQPAMMRIMRNINSGRHTMSSAIEEAFDYYNKRKSNSPYGGKTIDFNFTDEWLAENIAAEKNAYKDSASHLAEHDFANNQMKVLVILKRMVKAADALGDVVRAVRSDSQSGGAGGSIAMGNEKIDRVAKILDDSVLQTDYPLIGLDFLVQMQYASSEDDIINSILPIQTATYQWGLMATQQWYSKLFPQVSPLFQGVVKAAKSLTTYGNLDDTTVNRIYSHFAVFLMSGISKDFSGSQEAREYYINQFPLDFAEIKENNPYLVETLPIIRRLQVLKSNKYNGSPTIVFNNVGKVTDLQAEDYRSDFRNLLQNENTKDLARKLLIYSFYRGLGFSPSGFANLIPSLVKISDITDYVPALRQIINFTNGTGEMVSSFLTQYIRNNLDDRRLVPEVSSSGLFSDTPPESFTVTVSGDSSMEMKRFIYPIKEDKAINYRPYVCYTYKGVKNYYKHVGNGTYTKVEALGSSFYQEYDMNSVGDTMKTAIKPAVRKSFNMRMDYRAASVFEIASPGLEEQIASMPTFEDASPITLNDIQNSTRDMRAQQMEAQFMAIDAMRDTQGPPIPEDMAERFDAMESRFGGVDPEEAFRRFELLEESNTDPEGNLKCD